MGIKEKDEDFLAGPVVKPLTSYAVGTGSIPSPGLDPTGLAAKKHKTEAIL